jgi:von Hippel-Lindau disease tumor supressor
MRWLLLAIFAFALIGPADARCRGEGKLRSKVSAVATAVAFVNGSNEPVDIYWLDFRGARVFYNRIAAGDSYTQRTFVTHPWIAVKPDGGCRGPYLPRSTLRIVHVR